jgi:hypothetical protein
MSSGHSTTQPPTLRYRGETRSGNPVTGESAPGTTAGELADQLNEKRYRWAEITRDGRVVGGVSTAGNGARTWWGET